ncbi:Crp/Fnr family transcriptional regulator [Persicitalea sp.]|uniref:Crp/Fnr family transcriptional regulator n=1 Tax=Persicitalea sp. TaxID=3100273 RepID=UPI00359349E2
MTELNQYISSYFGVKSESLEKIASLFHNAHLDKGDFMLKTGHSCDQLSFIRSGLLRIFVTTERGDEVTQWISTQGYFVTDLSGFIFDTPARWTIQALSDAELFTISQADYQSIGSLVPEWHEFELRFITRCFTTMEDRIFTHLSMTAEERYWAFFENNKELFNQVPLQYIASMLGMTPETFSRIRKKASL